jgi:hypothetical protein
MEEEFHINDLEDDEDEADENHNDGDNKCKSTD